MIESVPFWVYPMSVSAAGAAWLVVRRVRRWWSARREAGTIERANNVALLEELRDHVHGVELGVRSVGVSLAESLVSLTECFAPPEPETPPMREPCEHPLEDECDLSSITTCGGFNYLFQSGRTRYMYGGSQFSPPHCYLLKGIEYRLVAPTGAAAGAIEADRVALLAALRVMLRVGVRDYYDGPLYALPLDYRESPIFIPQQQFFRVTAALDKGLALIDPHWRLKILLRGTLGTEVVRCRSCQHAEGSPSPRMAGGRCMCGCHHMRGGSSW